MPSRPLRRIARRLLPTLAALALGGCASNEFTLEADLPGDFSLVGDARYSPPEGHHCDASAGDDLNRRIFATPGHSERPYRVSYAVPLSLRSEGCTRVLSHIRLEMDGESATHPQDAVAPDISFAHLSIRDRLPAGIRGMPKKGTRIFDGRCRWLLPDAAGGERQLQCHASDINGSWFAGKLGGELQRDELPGRTVRLAIGVAPDVPASAGRDNDQTLSAVESSN